jgi:hypothetical protein
MPSLSTPPLLVRETLLRVLRVARFDGLSVLLVAGLFALLAAGAGDVQGALIGVTVALAGAIELHGVSLLQHGDARGLDWLVGSQVFLLVVLLGYCGWRLTHVELEPLRAAFHSSLRMPLMQQMWAANRELGLTEETFLQQIHTMTYASLAIATLIYQGGMTLYYQRRREPVTRALEAEDLP